VEITMEEQPDRDAIVDEAVGQTHGTAPPDTVKEREAMSPEEAGRRNATAPRVEASLSEKTAAALGERVGDAYANAGSVPQKNQRNVGQRATTTARSPQAMADRAFSAGQQMAQSVSEQFSNQPLVTMIAAFGLGFMTAVVLQGRR
jgi:hypothetical protein